jgi:hypothetical protein
MKFAADLVNPNKKKRKESVELMINGDICK